MTLIYFGLAAFFEIAGCFAFWSWLRQGRSSVLALAGIASLILFALCLARVDAAFAGRAFAAYGGIYIAASLAWLWLVERGQPDRWDLLRARFFFSETTAVRATETAVSSPASAIVDSSEDGNVNLLPNTLGFLWRQNGVVLQPLILVSRRNGQSSHRLRTDPAVSSL